MSYIIIQKANVKLLYILYVYGIKLYTKVVVECKKSISKH